MQTDADPQPTPDPTPSSASPAAAPPPETSVDPVLVAPITMGETPEPAAQPVPLPPVPADVPSFPAPAPIPPASLLLGADPATLGGYLPTSPAQPAPRRPASITFLVVVTALSLAADLVTKGWAKSRLDGVDAKSHALRHLDVWKGYIELIFAKNPGGAWSFLRNLPDSLRRPFFLVVSAGAIVFIVTIYQRVHRDQWAMRLGLPLALGGAAGNLVDRIRYGWVVDFIDFSLKWGGRDHHWPTFNVADIAIVVGVGLMAIDMLRSRGLPHEAHHPTMSPLSGGFHAEDAAGPASVPPAT